MKRHLRLPLLILSLALLTVPTLAAAAAVDGGIDLWQTRANGSTFADFAKLPIPAGFFCSRSEAFTGKIALRGVPVATGLPGELGGTDTIVERLDRASFDRNGTAATRIRVRALNLESIAPLSTACGDYNLRVTLNGNQPVTRMQIRQNQADGGSFYAPLQMNVKLTFTPASGKRAERLELTRNNFRLGAEQIPWSIDVNKRGFSHPGLVSVDTDGDGLPDTLLPGTSNFSVGRRAGLNKIIYCEEYCHSGDDGDHCTFSQPPAGQYCP